jgi:hypothetical protein
VVEPLDRPAELDEVDEQLGAPGEERAADGEERGKRERSGQDGYEDCAFPRSAIMTAPSAVPR